MSKLRKTFQRMEPAQQYHLTKVLESAGREIKFDAIGIAIIKDIKDTGAMIGSIDYKMGRDKSSVVIGPGAAATQWQKTPFDNTSAAAKKLSIKQKQAKWNFFKGYWAEFGTKGPVPQKPRSFMNQAFEENKAGIQASVRRAVKNALEEASSG